MSSSGAPISLLWTLVIIVIVVVVIVVLLKLVFYVIAVGPIGMEVDAVVVSCSRLASHMPGITVLHY